MSCTPVDDDRLSNVDARIVGAAEMDLGRLLSVEPSVEFAAMVRARIATEAPARGWRSRRLVLTLAAVSILIVAFSLRGGLSVRDNARPAVGPPHHDVVLGSTSQADATPVDQQTPPVLPAHRDVRPAPAGVARTPEVIVDPSIAVAIRRLAIAARSTALDDAAEATPPGVTPEPEALVVAEPLIVPELVLTPANQTGGM